MNNNLTNEEVDPWAQTRRDDREELIRRMIEKYKKLTDYQRQEVILFMENDLLGICS